MNYRLGFDIGGTFTDLVVVDQEGNVHLEKVPTTPPTFSEGAVHGIKKICSDNEFDYGDLEHVSHGTTVATNALIERNGATTGLLTTKGFQDVTAIGREKRDDIYDLSPTKTPMFTHRRHRCGVAERVTAEGEVDRPIDEEEVRQTVRNLADDGVESLAVSLLHSYRFADHERRIADIAREETDLNVSISSEVMKEIHEYERTLSTVIDAYVSPAVTEYVERLTDALTDLGVEETLHLMQANGGVVTPDTLDGRRLGLINSGPAAGVLGAKQLANASGFENIITLDMGGTSTDTSVVHEGDIERVTEGEIESVPLLFPQIDVRSIGTGGGSIAWLNSADVLKVGPDSSGADPGPACYGRGGTELTVTDAALVLGYLNPDYFLGGEMTLDESAANEALRTVADQLDMDAVELADGIVEIVTTDMLGGIRLVTVEKGYDPREFALTCYGGAGPLFADRLARKLGIRHALIPAVPGVLSAFGLVTADRRFDFSASHPLVLSPDKTNEINEIYGDLTERASEVAPNATMERAVDLRYQGQTFELTVEVPNGRITAASLGEIRERFERQYESVYGQINSDEAVEAITWRLDAVTETPPIEPQMGAGELEVNDAIKSTRSAYTADGFVEHTVYDRYRLPVDEPIEGPAIVEESESTTVIGANSSFRVDNIGNMIINVD